MTIQDLLKEKYLGKLVLLTYPTKIKYYENTGLTLDNFESVKGIVIDINNTYLLPGTGFQRDSRHRRDLEIYITFTLKVNSELFVYSINFDTTFIEILTEKHNYENLAHN